MNGLVVVNKEKNMTSFDVVREIKKIFHTKKVGHLGTLDPLAQGVLVVTVNDATKLAQFIENVDKEYVVTIIIGMETSTGDLEGEVTSKKEVQFIEKKQLIDTLNHFLGKSMQIPPMYSAIKKNGKKLYEYARKGLSIEVEPREIEVKRIELMSDPVYVNQQCEFSFKVVVSKGTYIRSLCKDIANALGYPGCMKELIRTRNGKFSIENASTLEQIKEEKFHFISMLDALGDAYPMIEDEKIALKAKNGCKIALCDVEEYLHGEKCFAIKKNNQLLAIYEFVDGVFRAVRVWN